jgi:hypothetical protein
MLDAAFQVPAILFALNKNSVPSPGIGDCASGENNIAELFDRPQLIESRLICHLRNEENLSPQIPIDGIAEIQHVLNAMVYIRRIF